MMTDKDSSAAGIDNRPSMLEENVYESWRILPPPRNKRDEEFTEEDNKNELVDIQAINILSVNNSRKKVICYNCHGERHVARQCKDSKHARNSQWYHDKALLMQAKKKGAKMQQEEHLNSEVDLVLNDNMITYDEYQNDSEVKTVPTVVSADEADKQSMIVVLQCMHTEIAGYVKVNDEHKLVNATLTAELKWCKIEMQALERNKVKYDLDMAIVERNKRNAELKEENVMLKSTLKSKVVSIENLQQKSK
nr:hypothetical protein [Tanacetum cinerariifolium]